MINYPDVQHGNQFSVLFFSRRSNGDVVIELSVGAHLLFGGHASIAFNWSEFLRKVKEL